MPIRRGHGVRRTVQARRQLSIGATYHRRVTFNVETTFFGSFLRTRIPGDPDTRESVVRTGDVFTVDYVLPSRFAVGASWRPFQTLTLAADWARIIYSERVSDRFLIVDFHDPDAGLVVDEDHPGLPAVQLLHPDVV